MKAKVENSEDARINYEKANQIWTINEKTDVTSEKLEEINKELTEAGSDRISKEGAVPTGAAVREPGRHTGRSRKSPVIQDVLKQQSALSAQYTDALNEYGPKFPKVVRLQEQLKDLDQIIGREKTNIVNQIEAEYRGSRQRLNYCCNRPSISKKTEASAMADKMVQYSILQREAGTNKQLYDGLLQKLKEAGISAGLRTPTTSAWWIRRLCRHSRQSRKRAATFRWPLWLDWSEA